MRIGEIQFQGLKRVHERLVRRRLLLHTGEQFNSSAVERARADLLTLGVFSAINVEVGSKADDTGGVPITFRMRERLRHSINVTAAYSTDLGGSGGMTWGDRNVFGNAEQLTVSTSLLNAAGSSTNGLGYDVNVKYLLPDFGHRDQSLQFSVGAIKQFLDAYDQTAMTAGVTLTRKLNKQWTVSAGVAAVNEKIIQVVGLQCAPLPFPTQCPPPNQDGTVTRAGQVLLHADPAAACGHLRLHRPGLAAGRSHPRHARFVEHRADPLARRQQRRTSRSIRSKSRLTSILIIFCPRVRAEACSPPGYSSAWRWAPVHAAAAR